MSRRRRIDRWKKDMGIRSRLAMSAVGAALGLAAVDRAGWSWVMLGVTAVLDLSVYWWPSAHVVEKERP